MPELKNSNLSIYFSKSPQLGNFPLCRAYKILELIYMHNNFIYKIVYQHIISNLNNNPFKLMSTLVITTLSGTFSINLIYQIMKVETTISPSLHLSLTTSLPLCHSAWQWTGFEHGRLWCKSVIKTFKLFIQLLYELF